MTKLSDDITVERYKYLLAQRQQLNNITFKIASVYQVIFLALCSAQYTVILEALDKRFDVKLALGASIFLNWVSILVSAVAVILLIGGMASWVNNRNDESGVLERIGQERRRPLELKSILIWYETYIIIAIMIFEVVYTVAHYCIVVPALGGISI